MNFKKGLDTITTLLLVVFLSIIGISMLKENKNFNITLNNNYLYSYGNNLLKSATEFSILNVLGHNFNNGCPNSFEINDTYFNVKGYYHFYMTNCNNCSNCTEIKTNDINGSFTVNIFVKSKIKQYPIYLHKLTLQNP